MVSEGNDQYIDMCLMTMCDGHIIANSSFSWWGAWLSKVVRLLHHLVGLKGQTIRT